MDKKQEMNDKEEFSNDEENNTQSSSSDENMPSTEPENNAWEAKLADAYGKHDDIQNKYLRVHADLENIKKRSIREREDAVQRTRLQLISDLLPIMDSFQMGLAEASKEEEAKTYVKGFDMIFKQFGSVLDQYGLVVIDPATEVFDPKLHEAIGHEFSEEIEDDHVVKTVRCGYKLGEKLIRPASVIVSKSQED